MRLFNYILTLSLKSCFVILAAMAVRRLIKGYSKKWSYLLWMPVFFGLVIQIGVPVKEDKPSDIPGTVIEENMRNSKMSCRNYLRCSLKTAKSVMPLHGATSLLLLNTTN